jgi:hypothetical protein
LKSHREPHHSSEKLAKSSLRDQQRMDENLVQKLHRKQPREHRQFIVGDVVCFFPALDKARSESDVRQGRRAAFPIIESEERDETVAEREAKMGALRLGSPARLKQRRFATPHRRSPAPSESSTTLREGRAMKATLGDLKNRRVKLGVMFASSDGTGVPCEQGSHSRQTWSDGWFKPGWDQ